MSYSSMAGQVILRQQAVQGTYQADTGTAGIGTKLRSGTLAPNRDLLIPDPEIGGNRDVTDAYLGPVSWSGDLEFYARPNMLLTLLAACLGAPASVTATGVTTYTYTPSDAAQLPFLSIEERVGAGLEVFNYTDVVCNTFHLEGDPSGYVMGTAGLIAAKQVAGATATPTPVWDASPMIVSSNVVITYNGVSFAPKSFSLDINNNFEDDDYRIGSLYLGDLSPKRREVTATFSVREISSALWRQAVYGSSASTSPLGKAAAKSELQIVMSTYEQIPGGEPAVYSVTLDFPNFALTPYAFAISGDDIITDDISGQAFRPVGSSDIGTIVVASDLAAVA